MTQWVLVILMTINGSYGKAVTIQTIPMVTKIDCIEAGGQVRDDAIKAEQPAKISFSCVRTTH